MSLSIKNELTCDLSRKLADLTGETITQTITVALQERLAREQNLRDLSTRAKELVELGRSCAALLGPGRPWRPALRWARTPQITRFNY